MYDLDFSDLCLSAGYEIKVVLKFKPNSKCTFVLAMKSNNQC